MQIHVTLEIHRPGEENPRGYNHSPAAGSVGGGDGLLNGIGCVFICLGAVLSDGEILLRDLRLFDARKDLQSGFPLWIRLSGRRRRCVAAASEEAQDKQRGRTDYFHDSARSRLATDWAQMDTDKEYLNQF